MSVALDELEEAILPLVAKPNRYLGNFEGACRKDHRYAAVRVAIAFPDCFDLGMSHLGIRILYRIVNSRDDALAELTFAPWPDMETEMRRHGLPLFTLESRTPVSEFDILGFSLQYELHYTTVLNMLDLACVPLWSQERTDSDPLVIAGGPCAFAPEPLAPFIDAFLIGDGEEALHKIVDVTAAAKAERVRREELLRRLAQIQGVYVPSLYELEPNSLGHLVPRPRNGVPEKIRPARIRRLSREMSEPAHLVPLIDVTHDRLSVEVMRGCPRKCRFCMPGTIYHPVRLKSRDEVLEELRSGMARGGWEEVSLLSLSTSDYRGIADLVQDISRLFLGRGVNVSIPSIRPGTLPPRLAKQLTMVRKSGLTFAPEAGSERLRAVIDKRISDEEIVESIKVAAQAGWKSVKLYFMVGFPTETEEDLKAIAKLCARLKQAGKGGGKRLDLRISAAGFVPKAHTPFQWEAQLDMEEMGRRLSTLNRMLRARGLKLRWRDVETTYLEGLLSRGDRRLAEVIHSAWRKGCKFDGWTDQLKFDKWKEAIEECNLDAESYLGPRDPVDPQPWDHVQSPVSVEALLRDRERALSGAPDDGGEPWMCPGSVQEGERELRAESKGELRQLPERAMAWPVAVYGRGRRRVRESQRRVGTCFRVRYSKLDPVRFISHLDVTRAFDRAIRKAQLPIAFSQGFSKHPRIAYGPPLAVGMTSVAEYLDLEFSTPHSAAFGDLLTRCLPEGLAVLQVEPHGVSKPPSLMSSITCATYEVRFTSYLARLVRDGQGDSALEEAMERAAQRLEAAAQVEGPCRRDHSRALVVSGQVAEDEDGTLLVLTVRLDVKKAPRVGEIVKGLLEPLEFDTRLLNVRRTGLWAERPCGLVSPFEVLKEGPWSVS